MAVDEQIKFAGDISIDQIQVVSTSGFSQNITNQVIALEIYEDMFSPFISGVLAVRESLDYINLMPLIGEEFINVKLHTPTFTGKDKIIDDQFAIYKITNRAQTGDRNMVYEIHFIAREAIVDLNKKISKAYEGKVSDIAEEILKDKINGLETTKSVNIEPTPNGTKYISNFWSPIQNLNYLAENAKNQNGLPTYIFFENRFGFNFGSLSTLNKFGIRQEFVYDGYSRDILKDGKSKRNVEEEYKRIIEIEVPILYDYMKRVMNGMYASKQINHDIVTKKYKVFTYDMLSDWNKEHHLNEFPVTSSRSVRRPSQYLMNSKSYWGNFNGYRDATNNSSSQKRISLIEQAQMNKVIITVPGRTDYTVGDKINLQLNKLNPIHTDEMESDDIDKFFSGNYLISSINHVIDRERHECVMEIIKDSYMLDPERGGR